MLENLECDKFTNEIFLLKLAYLSDFFSEVNTLNLSIQGNRVLLLTAQDKVAVFMRKLQLYRRRVEVGDITMFTALSTMLDSIHDSECSFTNEIAEHLQAMEDTLTHYFPNLHEREKNLWIVKPFSVAEEIVDDADIQAKIEFLSLRENSELKAVSYEKDHVAFWAGIRDEYPDLSKKEMRILVQAPTTYRCETGFSTMVTLKNKSRNRLEIDSDMRCALSQIEPRISKIMGTKQFHLSH